jgi:hypothetical protein
MEAYYELIIIIGAISTLISTVACPIIAARKYRSVVGWIFGGLFLGLIGVIIISCLPKDYSKI